MCWPRRSAVTARWSPRLPSSRQAKRDGTSAVEQGRPLQHYILVKSVSSDILLKVGEVCRLRLESKAVDKRVPRNWQHGQPDVGAYVEVSASRISEKFCEDLTRSPRPIAGLSVDRQESTITRRALNIIPSVRGVDPGDAGPRCGPLHRFSGAEAATQRLVDCFTRSPWQPKHGGNQDPFSDCFDHLDPPRCEPCRSRPSLLQNCIGAAFLA